MRQLSIVIPAYNEGQNIQILFDIIVQTCCERKMEESIELVWVDDGSKDDTWEQIQNVKSQSQNILIKAERHTRNQGLGAALRTGFSKAEGEYVTWMPGDGQIPISETLRIFGEMGEADAITSQRDRTEDLQVVPNPLTRKILTWGTMTLQRLLLGRDKSGHGGGPWIARREIVQSCKTYSNSGLVSREIMLYIVDHNYQIAHSHAHLVPRISGESKVSNIRTVWSTLWDMLRIRFYRWRNFYA
jgi:dolichol-phosphate mannosyltransferase